MYEILKNISTETLFWSPESSYGIGDLLEVWFYMNGPSKGLVGQLPNMGIPTAYVGACTSDPNPHPELI